MNDEGRLDGLIVEHIADLEAARRRIDDSIDVRLLAEAVAVVKACAEAEGWAYESTKGAWLASLAPEAWVKRADGRDIAWTYWFGLRSVDALGEASHSSYLADFLQLEGGSSRMALSFSQDVLGKRKWRALLSLQLEPIKALRDGGFDVDEREGSISLPVRLDSRMLKRAFEEDLFEEAFAPVAQAIELAVKALPHFEELIGRARDSDA